MYVMANNINTFVVLMVLKFVKQFQHDNTKLSQHDNRNYSFIEAVHFILSKYFLQSQQLLFGGHCDLTDKNHILEHHLQLLTA